MLNFVICAAIISSVFSILAIVTAGYALIKVLAAEQSTHNLEYVPMDPKWASSDQEIEEFNERHSSDFLELDDNEVDSPEELRLRNLI